MSNRNNTKGFTLTELLLVVLIIAILASFAVPMYKKAVWKVRSTEAPRMVKTIERALDLYVMQNGCPTASSGTTLTPDDLGIEYPFSSSYPVASVFGHNGYCTKYTCFAFDCRGAKFVWYGTMYTDIQHAISYTTIAGMQGTREADGKWHRECYWREALPWPGITNPTKEIGQPFCMSTGWDEIGGQFL